MERNSLDAVSRSALTKLLTTAGLMDEFDRHEILCHACQRPIDWNNLCAVFMENDKLCFLCTSYACYQVIRSRRNTGAA